jgi:hypothetical protein
MDEDVHRMVQILQSFARDDLVPIIPAPALAAIAVVSILARGAFMAAPLFFGQRFFAHECSPVALVVTK